MRSALASFAVVTAVVATAAQTPAPPAKPGVPPEGSTVTVTGCLAKGEASGAFVLNKVRWDAIGTSDAKQAGRHHDQAPAPSPPPLAIPSTPSTAPAPSAAKATADEALRKAMKPASGDSLRLAGNATTLKLADHVGHTMTATGMLGSNDPVVTPAVVLPDKRPAGGKPAPANNPTASDVQMRVLNVRSVTHVAGECK